MTLSGERLRELTDCDLEAGVLTRRVAAGRYGRIPAGTVVGWKNCDGYVSVMLDSKSYMVHRLVWLHAHGVWPPHEVDHINGRRDDNRLVNLRLATKSENRQNLQGAPTNNTSGIVGVSWNARCQKWTSQLILNGKRVHHSYHNTFEEAVVARRAAEARFHPFAPQRV